jgi:hypothetical protein
VFSGIAVLGGASFAYFGLRGHSELSDLRASCLGHCAQDDVDRAWSKLVVADVSLGVGVVAAGVAAWLFLMPRASTSHRPRAAPPRASARGSEVRRATLVLALATAPIACTLIDSRDGLVGPPLASADAGGAEGGPDAGDGGAGDARMPVPDVLYDNQKGPSGIAVVGDFVYWVAGQPSRGLLRAPRAGGGAAAIVHLDDVAEPIGDAFDLTADATYVYWGDRGNGLLWRKALAGGAPKEQCFPGAISAAYLTLGPGGLFVTDFREDDAGVGLGTVVSGPCPGSATVVYAGQPRASGIAAVGGTLYWGRAMPDAVQTGPAAGGGGGNPVVTPGGAVTGVAGDAKGLFWIEDSQRVVRFDFASRVPMTVYAAAAPFGESDVAVDDAAVYWTEHDNGVLRRLAR